MGLGAYFRLLRAGYVLAREGALSIVDRQILPPGLRFGIGVGRLFERGSVKRTGKVERLNRALNRLGPTYVKFGQTLATRPDIVGVEIAAELAILQDKMDPFDSALVPAMLAEALKERAAELTELSPPIAAASIAQVHKAVLVDAAGNRQEVAVKILRPGIRQRFRADLESYYAGARLAERTAPALRRLRPTDVVATLDRSARIELDLRLEAAAISEMAENTKGDSGFIIPTISWDHTTDTVLTTTWSTVSRSATSRRWTPPGSTARRWPARCCRPSSATPSATATSTPTCIRETSSPTPGPGTSSRWISASWGGFRARNGASSRISSMASSPATTR